MRDRQQYDVAIPVSGERQLQCPFARGRIRRGEKFRFERGDGLTDRLAVDREHLHPWAHAGGFRGRVVAHIDDHRFTIPPDAEDLRLRRHQPR